MAQFMRPHVENANIFIVLKIQFGILFENSPEKNSIDNTKQTFIVGYFKMQNIKILNKAL